MWIACYRKCARLFSSAVCEKILVKWDQRKKSYNFKILLHSKINSVLSIDFLPCENLITMYWFRFHLLELGYFYSLYIWEKKVIDLSERVINAMEEKKVPWVRQNYLHWVWTNKIKTDVYNSTLLYFTVQIAGLKMSYYKCHLCTGKKRRF